MRSAETFLLKKKTVQKFSNSIWTANKILNKQRKYLKKNLNLTQRSRTIMFAELRIRS